MENHLNRKAEYRIEGIIIKQMDYKENSKLIYILTKDGLVSLEAKGSNSPKSKNGSYSKILTKICCSYRGHTLTTGKVIDNYTNLKTDVKRYGVVSSILELSYTLAPYITNFDTFYNFVSNIFDFVNNKEDYSIYERIFRVKSLYLLGIAPVLTKCVKCGKKQVLVGFSLSDGGMLCMDCVRDMKNLRTGKYIDLFRYLYFSKTEEIDAQEVNTLYDKSVFNDLDRFLDDYYETYIGYVSKSRKILSKIEL